MNVLLIHYLLCQGSLKIVFQMLNNHSGYIFGHFGLKHYFVITNKLSDFELGGFHEDYSF